MKKYFLLALSAVALLTFTGCEDPNEGKNPDEPDPNTETAVVTVSPKTLILSAEQEERLSATISPAPTTNVTFTWTSEDPAVATVTNAGVVTAIALGTTNIIVSAEGCTPDTCVVSVTNDAVLDNYQLNNYGIFGTPTMIPGTEEDIKMLSGDVYKCQLGYCYFYAWDNNITFMNGVGFGGAGYFIEQQVPIYWIIEGDYSGYYVGSAGGWYVAPNEQDTLAPYSMTSGELVDLQKYGDFWSTLVSLTADDVVTEELYALYEDSQIGTHIFELDFSDGYQSYYLGNVKAAHIYENDDDELQYNMTIEWYDFVNEYRFYGMLYDGVDADGYITSIAEPYDMRTILKEYTNVAEDAPAEAPMYKIGKQANVYKDADYAVKQVKMATQKMYRK